MTDLVSQMVRALEELLIDMQIAQRNMRSAAKRDQSWEGCAEAIQPRVDAAQAALTAAKAGGWQPIQTAPTDGTKFLGWRRGQVATSYRVPRDDCEMWCFGGTSGAFEHWPETRPEFWMPHPPEPSLAAAQAKDPA